MAKTTKARTKTTASPKKATKKTAATSKKASPKNTSAKRAATVSATQQPFFQVRITDQSLYWLIFGTVAILFSMWIYTLDSRVRDLYDQIDRNTYSIDPATEIKLEKLKADQAQQAE